MTLTGAPLWIVLAALAFDAVLGDPAFIWRRIPHPVAWFGALIDLLERCLNRADLNAAQKRFAGIVTALLLLAAAVSAGLLIEECLRQVSGGNVVIALIASVFIAQQSLYRHVAHVRDALAESLDAGRRAVAMIVGRDPDRLDEKGVSSAAIESCAESFSDGIAAPVFWLALLGLPGLFAYKAINTADSMIGHRDARYEAFGFAAARLDDLMNLVPARLAGLLICAVAFVAGGNGAIAQKTMWRDAKLHHSPNAGWPEAAMAGALGVTLGGARSYDGVTAEAAVFNEGAQTASTVDISRALKILAAACVLHAALYAIVALAFWR